MNSIITNAGSVASGIVNVLGIFSAWVLSDDLMAVILGIGFAGLGVAFLMRLWKGASLG